MGHQVGIQGWSTKRSPKGLGTPAVHLDGLWGMGRGRVL